MNFSLELKISILSHPVTSKQPHKIVQRLMGHPVHTIRRIKGEVTYAMDTTLAFYTLRNGNGKESTQSCTLEKPRAD